MTEKYKHTGMVTLIVHLHLGNKMDAIITHLSENWAMWVVSATLVVAAVIDGMYLKVPNNITYPLIVAGWLYSAAVGGWVGLGWSLAATFFGLALLFGFTSLEVWAQEM